MKKKTKIAIGVTLGLLVIGVILYFVFRAKRYAYPGNGNLYNGLDYSKKIQFGETSPEGKELQNRINFLNNYLQYPTISVDGIVGSETIGALQYIDASITLPMSLNDFESIISDIIDN